METKIRPATLDDANQLYLLAQEFASSFEIKQAPFEESLREIIRDQQALLLVLEGNGLILGYCMGFAHKTFFANGAVAWLEELFVKSNCRKLGFGKLLVTEFELWSIQKEAKLVALATRRASEFYQAIGYELSAEYYRKIL